MIAFNIYSEKISGCVRIILLLAALIPSGCASITLNTWNEEFEEDHQRTVEFPPPSFSADYLGKMEGSYVYRALDSKKQTVVFRLPAKNNAVAKIDLDDSEDSVYSGKTAMFHFDDYGGGRNDESDFPRDIRVFASADMTAFSYSCNDGEFHNEIHKSILLGTTCNRSEKNCHGLSSSDSFKLGMRKGGYLITVPLDIASLPVTLPLGIIFVSTYCGPFGCP